MRIKNETVLTESTENKENSNLKDAAGMGNIRELRL